MTNILARIDNRLAAIVREIDALVAERDRLVSFKRTYDEYAGEPAPEKAHAPAPEGEGDAASPSPIPVPAREGHAADAGEAARAPASPATHSLETANEPGDGSQPSPSEGSSLRANVSIGATRGERPAHSTISGSNYSDPIPPTKAAAQTGSDAEPATTSHAGGDAVASPASSSHASGKPVGSKGPAAPLKSRILALNEESPDLTARQAAKMLGAAFSSVRVYSGEQIGRAHV